MKMASLLQLSVVDECGRWGDIGFSVCGEEEEGGGSKYYYYCRFVKNVKVFFINKNKNKNLGDGKDVGVNGWSFFVPNRKPGNYSICGIPTVLVNSCEVSPDKDGNVNNRNFVNTIDHVVVNCDDLNRFQREVFAVLNLEPRRERIIANGKMKQVFYHANSAVLEVIGPTTTTTSSENDITANIWGIAFASSDLLKTKEYLGEKMGNIKNAVQKDRQIGTIRTNELNISLNMAVLSRL